jgi:hypothetical protein
MLFEIIERINEPTGEYVLSYYRIKFLGEILEITNLDISTIDIVHFWLERKASRNYYRTYRYYPNSLKWKIISGFWSRLAWNWWKIYYQRRNNRGEIK